MTFTINKDGILKVQAIEVGEGGAKGQIEINQNQDRLSSGDAKGTFTTYSTPPPDTGTTVKMIDFGMLFFSTNTRG